MCAKNSIDSRTKAQAQNNILYRLKWESPPVWSSSGRGPTGMRASLAFGAAAAGASGHPASGAAGVAVAYRAGATSLSALRVRHTAGGREARGPGVRFPRKHRQGRQLDGQIRRMATSVAST